MKRCVDILLMIPENRKKRITARFRDIERGVWWDVRIEDDPGASDRVLACLLQTFFERFLGDNVRVMLPCKQITQSIACVAEIVRGVLKTWGVPLKVCITPTPALFSATLVAGRHLDYVWLPDEQPADIPTGTSFAAQCMEV